jgi:AcrR family transcriptional regulator
MAAPRKAGRPRESNEDRQQAILAVASHLFASMGYEKTTIRLVAQRAGVDPKLVMHYFENKHKLFISCMNVPVEATAALALTKTLTKSQWGSAIAELVWEIQQQKDHPLISLIRASASDPEAAEMAREFYWKSLLEGLSQKIDIDHRELRLMMVSSLVSGFTFSNKIIGIFNKSKISDKNKKALLASAIQNILTAKI